MNQHQEFVIRALGNMMGDDAARARAAFRNCTPEQMKEQYGQSGQTRAQVLAGHEEHNAKVQAAIDWVTSLEVTEPDATECARPLLTMVNWHEAPRKTEWGAGMMAADVMLDEDETMTVYVHRDALRG